jgi:hypothetical protein
MGERVSVREMARRRGCTHGAVQKAISDGRIPASRSSATRRPHQVDRLRGGDARLEQRTPTSTRRRARSAALRRWRVRARDRRRRAAARDAGARGAERRLGRAGARAGARGERRRQATAEPAARARAAARDRRPGVARGGARDRARRYRAARDQLLTVPDRVADILAAERDPARVHAILLNELEQALHGLSESATAESAALAPGELPSAWQLDCEVFAAAIRPDPKLTISTSGPTRSGS